MMKQRDLKQQLYLIVLKVIILISILAIIGNIICHFPFRTNIKWLFLVSIAFLSLLYEKHKGFSDLNKFVLLFFLNGIFMPLSFIDAGGSRSNTLAYIFLSLIVVSYLLEGVYRYILIATIIAVFMGVTTYEYIYPERIPVYDLHIRYIDSLIQVPIVILITFLVVRHFADAYFQANKRLFRIAHYDELTGLLNRRNFNDILQKQFDSGENNGYLIMIDVDNFKLINDRKGHLVGDDGLKKLSRILRESFEDGKNMISRWGGDEFIIIYFGELDQLEAILEKVNKEFKEYTDPIEPLVDLSYGIAPLKGCLTPYDVLAKSDQIMYEKKRIKKDL